MKNDHLPSADIPAVLLHVGLGLWLQKKWGPLAVAALGAIELVGILLIRNSLAVIDELE